MNILDIKEPRDIKNMSIEELEKLSRAMRDFLIESTAKTGGHLGSSLGTVELITALHYVFDSPKDKLIFDIGHQAYVHKILTGRAKNFETLRKYKGLSGFLTQEESKHDIWSSGHAANSISAAVGFAMKRDLDEENNHVVAIIGDGALTNGMAIEALNHIISINQKIIIIINDNEMSISKNVGFIDNILKNMETSTSYDKTKQAVRESLDKIDSSGKITKIISKSKNKIKNEINRSQGFFNLIGFKYYGIIDGHNFDDLIKIFEKAKKVDGPLVIHVKTEKGKGYLPAEINRWHATPPFNIEDGKPLSNNNNLSNSSFFAKVLLNLMKDDKDIVIVSPAMFKGSELDEIDSMFPNRITDVGIAEEHATTLTAGLALSGKKPFLSIYSTFLQRAYDQVFQDIIRQKCNVVVGIDRAGISGGDGETHQGLYDISLLSHMPGVIIAQGRNPSQTKSLIHFGFKIQKPFFIRYSRGGSIDCQEVDNIVEDIKNFNWEIIKKLSKINIITYGEQVEIFKKYYENNLNIGIIDAKFIKPIDKELLLKISDTKLIVVEEAARLGGLGSLILNYYNENNIKTDVIIKAIDDHFVKHGSIDTIRKIENIDIDSVDKIIELLRKNKGIL